MSADEQHSVKAQRAYLVLVAEDGDDGVVRYQPTSHQEARSAEAAVRQYVEGIAGTHPPLTVVAVPLRNWNPLKVTPRTVTTLEIEEAT